MLESSRAKGVTRKVALIASWLAPVVLAAIPLVTLLGENIDSVAPRAAVRPLLATILVAGLASAAGWAVLRDRERALLLASFLMLFWAGGTLREAVRAVLDGTSSAGLSLAADIAWRVCMLGCALLVVGLPRIPRDLSVVLFAIGVPMLLLPSLRILRYEVYLRQPYSAFEPLAQPSPSETAILPDIYYVVLDGYGRQDVLADLHDIEIAEFVAALRDLGFYVPDRSHANYGQTTLSLASSLNMDYLDGVVEKLGAESTNSWPVNQLIRHSALRAVLEGHGYDLYAFETGYRKTELEDVPHYLISPARGVTALEALYLDVLDLTPFIGLMVEHELLPEYPGYAAHRDRIRFSLGEALTLAKRPGPKFVFLHLILPHPPFVFDSQGNGTSPLQPFDMKDGSEFYGTPVDYVSGYSEQMRFTNREILSLVEGLLETGQKPPVIILQADHGPGSRLDWDEPERTNLQERMSIFSAYYAPLAREGLYPSISPVNSFRLLLNSYFGYDLPILPDESFFSSWRAPYEFIPYSEPD